MTWRDRNKDRVNQKRKEHRAKLRAMKFSSKRCLLCEFPMISKFAGCRVARVYCNDCMQRNPLGVSRHKWRRYYKRKMLEKELQDKTTIAYYRQYGRI